MYNICLSEDKKSFKFDVLNEEGETIRDLEIIGNVELPELPSVGTDSCCDLDGWVSRALDTIKSIGTRVGPTVGEISKSVEHIAQSKSAANSPCPPKTGREYGYEDNGNLYNK
ncbi:hypothetical protein [Mesonia phycicola]|nr:hypothetical protein [Mesonia phycicola]